MGFEPTPPFGDQNPQHLRRLKLLESGALDHSAILTLISKVMMISAISAASMISKYKKMLTILSIIYIISSSFCISVILKVLLSEVGFEPTP